MKSVPTLLVAAMTLAAPLSSTFAQSVTFSEGIFSPADWTFTTLQATGPVSGSRTHVLSGGNPDDYWRHAYNIAQTGAPTRYIATNINNAFRYDPGVQGALASVTFSFDLFGFSSTALGGSFGFFYAALQQNGQVFYGGGGNVPTSNTWTTFASAPIGANAWRDPLDPGSALRPDFSATGGEITFGYLLFLGTSCSATLCNAAAFQSGLDNFSVTATAASISTVPEPSTYALMATALAGLFVISRHRRKA